MGGQAKRRWPTLLRHGLRKLAALLTLAALLPSCASPTERLLRLGEESGFAHKTLAGKGFRLEAFAKGGRGEVLHVYLEGDGLPWASFDQISADPTPRHPLMLELMRQDRSPALYLGRPCYNGHAQDPGCSPWLWTHGRYGAEVVESMAAALAGFLLENPRGGLVFLGHSGGGALALLLAQRFPETLAVLTLAGNTDIDVWADLHHYSRLRGSLNPANFAGGAFPEIHYLGENDATIPPALFRPLLGKRRTARIVTVAGFDHVCCWDALWPKILHDVP